MRRRKINKKDGRQEYLFGFTKNFIPKPSLQLMSLNHGVDVKLIWTVDFEFIDNIKYYEVYLNDELIAETSDMSEIYPSLTPEEVHNFKVRGVGYHGETGLPSDVQSVTGAGLPPLYLEGAFYEVLGMSIWWSDVQDNAAYDIIGYHVYYASEPGVENLEEMTRLTDELITYTAYTKFVETFDEQISTMAVTYTYVGSQIESGGFFVSPATNGAESSSTPVPIKKADDPEVTYPGGVYKIGLENRSSYTFVNTFGDIGTRILLEGSNNNIAISGEGNDEGFRYGLRWSGIYFNGDIDYYTQLNIGGMTSGKRYRFNKGCTAERNDWRYISGDFIRITNKAHRVRLRSWRSPAHTVIGGCGNDLEFTIKREITATIAISEGVRNDDINDDLLPDGVYIIGETNISRPPNTVSDDGETFSTGRGSLSF